MKVSTLKAKSALFDVNKIKGSENKILTATKDIRKDYDSSRGFGLATLTAITTYKDPKQGFKSRDEFESLLYEALAHGASDIIDKGLATFNCVTSRLAHPDIIKPIARTLKSFLLCFIFTPD